MVYEGVGALPRGIKMELVTGVTVVDVFNPASWPNARGAAREVLGLLLGTRSLSEGC